MAIPVHEKSITWPKRTLDFSPSFSLAHLSVPFQIRIWCRLDTQYFSWLINIFFASTNFYTGGVQHCSINDQTKTTFTNLSIRRSLIHEKLVFQANLHFNSSLTTRHMYVSSLNRVSQIMKPQFLCEVFPNFIRN
jgi:hypothetical protein